MIQDGTHTLTGSKADLELPLKLNPGESNLFVVIPDAELKNPGEAFVSLHWEGMQQHRGDGTLADTIASFSIVGQGNDSSGNTVTVFNPIESKMKVDGAKVFILSDDKEIPVILKNISFPVEIEPASTITFDAIRAMPIPEGECEARSHLIYSAASCKNLGNW